jgi:hypothetical protein
MRGGNNPILNSKRNGKAKNSGNIKTLTQNARIEVDGNPKSILVMRMERIKYALSTKITTSMQFVSTFQVKRSAFLQNFIHLVQALWQ